MPPEWPAHCLGGHGFSAFQDRSDSETKPPYKALNLPARNRSRVQLYPTPDNPIPAAPQVERITTRDGVPIRVARWMPAGPEPRGTVCILQGRAEFIEKYFEVVQELLDRELRRRHLRLARPGPFRAAGAQSPSRAMCGSFSHYRRDLEAVRDQVLPDMPEPHFALAHSMGGAIALDAAYEGWLPFRRLVTTTPMIALVHRRPSRLAPITAARPEPARLRQVLRPGRRRDVDLQEAVRRQPPHQRSRSATPATPRPPPWRAPAPSATRRSPGSMPRSAS